MMEHEERNLLMIVFALIINATVVGRRHSVPGLPL